MLKNEYYLDMDIAWIWFRNNCISNWIMVLFIIQKLQAANEKFKVILIIKLPYLYLYNL
jgi:hypothetical protein